MAVSRAPKNAGKKKSVAKKSTKSVAKSSIKKDKKGAKSKGPRLFPTKAELEAMKLAREAKAKPAEKSGPRRFPTKVQKVAKEKAIDEALELLNKFGLKEKADQYPDRLSGGQQQRVAIIRSLARHPRLLLLDEITSALDPVLVNEVLSTVRDLKSEGMTMVLATHEMGFAKQVADELCYLHQGRILEWGSPKKILESPKKSETKEFLRRLHQAGRL